MLLDSFRDEMELTDISAFAPLYDSLGELAAYICITRPEIRLEAIIPQFILSIFLASAIASAIMMYIIYKLLNKRFLAPIATLTKSAEEMIYNIELDRPLDIDVHTGDELETMAEPLQGWASISGSTLTARRSLTISR